MSRPLIIILIAWSIGLGGWIILAQNQTTPQQSAELYDAWDRQLVSPNNPISTSNTRTVDKDLSTTPSPTQIIITTSPSSATLFTTTPTIVATPKPTISATPKQTPIITPLISPATTPTPVSTTTPTPTPTPTSQATTTPALTPNQSALININTANTKELEKITGIGPAYAKNIIDYRNTNGPFHKIEDIVNVKGIGPKTFEKMKSEITV